MQAPKIETIALPDGYHAHVRWWRHTKPRGAVLYLHGIQSHGGWYEASGSLLAERGLAVLMPDRRGSGLNDPPRGHFDSVDQSTDDTHHLLDVLLRETGLDAGHVVGVSWGGRQAVLLAHKAPRKIQSLTLVGPGLFPKVDLTPAEKFRVAVAMINHRDKSFDIPLEDARLFTANPERLDYVEKDPLRLRGVTASFLLASRRMDKVIRRFAESAYRGPIHLFLVRRDNIIQNEPTRRWLRELPSPDRRITEYLNAGHTIEFEEDPRQFFEDLVGWIVEHCD